jgi:hypothetical protein
LDGIDKPCILTGVTSVDDEQSPVMAGITDVHLPPRVPE